MNLQGRLQTEMLHLSFRTNDTLWSARDLTEKETHVPSDEHFPIFRVLKITKMQHVMERKIQGLKVSYTARGCDFH